MRKIFTLLMALVIAVPLFTVQASTAIYDFKSGTLSQREGTTKKNVLNYSDGATLSISGRDDKDFSGYDSKKLITINGKGYQYIKNSNGAEMTYVAPEGMAVAKVKIYTFVNSTDQNVSYWKIIGPNTYTAETGTIITQNTGSSDCYTNPTIVTDEFETPLPLFALNNGGKQLCFILEVELVPANDKINPELKWSANEAEVSILDTDPELPILTVAPSENAAEIISAVTYGSSDEAVATIDATGKVAIVGEGTTKISAQITESETMNPATASYTLTVKGLYSTAIYSMSDGTLSSWDGKNSNNQIIFPNGAHLDLTGNPEKSYSTAKEITYNGSKYQTIKGSNKAANTFYAPDGYSVTKVTFISYVNIAQDKLASARTTYWSRVGSTTFTEETAQILVCPNDKLDNPDIFTYEFETPCTSFNYNNEGEQVCTIMEIELMEGKGEEAKIITSLRWSDKDWTVDYGESSYTFPTLAVSPVEHEAEILAAVKYSSSDQNVATINDKGEITIVAIGTTTIRAAIEEMDNMESSYATYTLVVNDPTVINKSWDFTTWSNAKYEETTIVDGLTIHANVDKWMEVNNKIFKCQGGASINGDQLTRALSFEVPGPVKITVNVASSSSAERSVGAAAGEWTSLIGSHPAMATTEDKVFYYEGDATTIYVYSLNGGLSFSSISVVTIDPSEAPAAPTVTCRGMVDGVVELNEDGNVVVEFDLAEGHNLYYHFEADPAATPARAIHNSGKTYNVAEDNTVAVSTPGTLEFFAQDPASGKMSEIDAVTIVKAGTTTAITKIEAEAAGIEYYNLQGIRVENPSTGLYIRRQGEKASKVYIIR